MFVVWFTFVWKLPAMEHFCLYLIVSIYLMAALKLPRRIKATLPWEALRDVTEKTDHNGKLHQSEPNSGAQKK